MQSLEYTLNNQGDRTTKAQKSKIPLQKKPGLFGDGSRTTRTNQHDTCLYSDSVSQSSVSYQISILKEQVSALKAQNERLLRKISQINTSKQ